MHTSVQRAPKKSGLTYKYKEAVPYRCLWLQTSWILASERRPFHGGRRDHPETENRSPGPLEQTGCQGDGAVGTRRSSQNLKNIAELDWRRNKTRDCWIETLFQW